MNQGVKGVKFFRFYQMLEVMNVERKRRKHYYQTAINGLTRTEFDTIFAAFF